MPHPSQALASASPALLIEARSDAQAALSWLAEHADAPATLNSYRKESERLLMWLARRGQKLAEVKRNDVLDYQTFLASPYPEQEWMGPARPRSHPDWKPFSKPLTPASVRHSLTVLGAMFSYLNDAGYLNGNPFKLLKRGKRQHSRLDEDRFLDVVSWRHIQDTLDRLPRDTPREQKQAERANWLFTLLYLTGARRSEVALARASDLVKRNGNWWWHICGKGGVAAKIPFTDECMAAMRRYRSSLGLPTEPTPQDDTPLVCRTSAKNLAQPLSDKAIYLICKEIFTRAEQETEDAAMKLRLRQATTHWLRHTAASHQLEAGVPLLMVSQNLRHASIQTTRRYLHSEEDARHEASQQHQLRAAEGK
ncbi:site-specific integrase [Chromobacterium sp. IIBBL 290-4]|uniref:tyrosine-type recombinase/integrase n=1 Tax=Chromobacterium sp. IIBBL 290-4 TaxID=2953890 RepID=UPI0020B83099|nr:site-specific integrase [Chromobacterium sp. IIBBL 290-4]UTH73849.1 site-specific integrase [Chromobacterium sp. IIBBL 290-4]